MEIKITVAQIKDMQKIQQLNDLLCQKEEEEYKYGIDLNWVYSDEGKEYYKERITKNDGCTFIATFEEEIIGYLIGGICEPESYRKIGKMAELETFYVIEKFRSHRVGSKLYDVFKNWCKDKKIKIVKVDVHALNSQGINFYEKKGLKPYSLIMEGSI